MKTEKEIQSQHQINVELDALPFASKESEPKKDEDDDHIIMSTNEYSPLEEPSLSLDRDEETIRDQKLEQQLNIAQTEYHSLLDLKVVNELVVQYFNKDEETDGLVSIGKIADVLVKEKRLEKQRNIEAALYLESMIKVAEQQEEPDYSKGIVYTKRDLQSMRTRVDTHLAMHEFIRADIHQDEDAEFKLAETYIKRLQKKARTEAIDILLQLNEELEAKKSDDDALIGELEVQIQLAEAKIVQLEAENTRLKGENGTLKEAVTGRDFALWDRELTDAADSEDIHRQTEIAKSYAK